MLSTELRDKVRRLDSLRREAESAARASGSLADYIDRGRPNDEQRAKAYADMAQEDERFKRLSERLASRLAELRRDEPEVVAAWVGLHRQVCGDILAEPAPDESFASVRAFVAGQTLAAWDKLAQGDDAFVYINRYYLAGYDELWDQLCQDLTGCQNL
jgi:hypothetical protein